MVHIQQLYSVLMSLYIAGALAVTTEQDQALGAICEGLIADDQANIPAFVRLIFHDCVSGCDGCVDTSLTESNHGDRVSAGLQPAIDTLNDAYNQFVNTGISRADFYAKCGQVAAEQGRQNAGNSQASDLPMVMRYGRVDCDGSPRERAEDFPNPRMGLDGVLSWCSRVFKFTERECVAILGAHTLGRARPQASGYNFPWVAGGQNDLDNRFYIAMINRNWIQENVAPEETGSGARWQYTTNERLMLNTDICLLKNISADQFGQAETNTSLVGNSKTASIVLEFASSNPLWLNDFGRAYTKIMENGNNLEDISDNATPVTTPVTTPAPTVASTKAPTQQPTGAVEYATKSFAKSSTKSSPKYAPQYSASQYVPKYSGSQYVPEYFGKYTPTKTTQQPAEATSPLAYISSKPSTKQSTRSRTGIRSRTHTGTHTRTRSGTRTKTRIETSTGTPTRTRSWWGWSQSYN